MFSVDWDDLPSADANIMGGMPGGTLRHIIYSAEGPHFWSTQRGNTFDPATGVPCGITHVPAYECAEGEGEGGGGGGDGADRKKGKTWTRFVQHLYGRPIQGGRRVMLGGSRLLDGFDERVDEPTLKQTHAYACKFLPAVGHVEPEGHWGGLSKIGIEQSYIHRP